jgi:hypothetical protein
MLALPKALPAWAKRDLDQLCTQRAIQANKRKKQNTRKKQSKLHKLNKLNKLHKLNKLNKLKKQNKATTTAAGYDFYRRRHREEVDHLLLGAEAATMGTTADRLRGLYFPGTSVVYDGRWLKPMTAPPTTTMAVLQSKLNKLKRAIQANKRKKQNTRKKQSKLHKLNKLNKLHKLNKLNKLKKQNKATTTAAGYDFYRRRHREEVDHLLLGAEAATMGTTADRLRGLYFPGTSVVYDGRWLKPMTAPPTTTMAVLQSKLNKLNKPNKQNKARTTAAGYDFYRRRHREEVDHLLFGAEAATMGPTGVVYIDYDYYGFPRRAFVAS